MKYEIILFDIDDTLFDFGMSEEKALHNTFKAFGLPTGWTDYRATYNEISHVLWGNLERGLTTITELGVERFKQLFQMHALDIDAHIFSAAYLDYLGQETDLMQGAVEVCDTLVDHYRLAVITNGFTKVQTSRIGNSALNNMFEQLIISEEAGFQKPESGIFDYAFSKLRATDKTKVLIVGDSLTSDIQGGINYGIDTCWFNPHLKENKVGVKPTYIIHELRDLLAFVR